MANKYTHTTKLLINNNVPTLSTASVKIVEVSVGDIKKKEMILEAVFSETLKSEKPDKGDFTVMVGSDTRRISSYTMSGAVLTFKLVTPIQSSDTNITLGYKQSTGANAKVLKDLANNKVADFSGSSVTNGLETTVPTLSTVVATRTKVTLMFSEDMKQSPKPLAKVFSIEISTDDGVTYTDGPSVFDYTLMCYEENDTLKCDKAELLLLNPYKPVKI